VKKQAAGKRKSASKDAGKDNKPTPSSAAKKPKGMASFFKKADPAKRFYSKNTDDVPPAVPQVENKKEVPPSPATAPSDDDFVSGSDFLPSESDDERSEKQVKKTTAKRARRQRGKVQKQTIHVTSPPPIAMAPQNGFPCNGQCGKSGCEKGYATKASLVRHLSTKIFTCPVEGCDVTRTQNGKMIEHFRLKHSTLVSSDGSCEKYKIPAHRTKAIFLPESFKTRINAQTWTMLTKQGTRGSSGYRWIVDQVRHHLRHDRDNKSFSDEDRAYANSVTNVGAHAIAQDILDKLIVRGMFDDGAIDDAGGRLPHGFAVHAHGGLWALSCDRADNAQPHFSCGKPALTNVRLVAAGMNNFASIVGNLGGKETCGEIRKAVNAQHQVTDVERAMHRAQHQAAGDANVLYNTSHSVYFRESQIHNKHMENPEAFSQGEAAATQQFHRQFPSSDALFRHVRKKFVALKGRCEISSILMDNASNAPDWFKPSLDAINPRQGHVKGNLRLICRFLNNINHDKVKQFDSPDDPESAWTQENLYGYINHGQQR
jgi:hypothetical protein